MNITPVRCGKRGILTLAAVLAAVVGRAETPVVVFDVPLITECRKVTPQGFREAYRREIIEAVFKVSPQLLAGDEKDLKRLHYAISTEQQMPVVGFLPNSQVGTDVVNGTIAIQNSSRHGEISFRYLILPNTGNGEARGDLESSNAEYGLLAPRHLLIAAGTIDRGSGVYFELRQSSQDTLQKQREFACLFDVPETWRADYVTIRCNAKGIKRGLAGLLDSEVACGSGLLCVGLYKQDDAEARAYADQLARKQHAYFNRLTEQAKTAKTSKLCDTVAALDRLFAGTKTKAKLSKATAIGAAVQSQLDEGQLAALTPVVQETQPGGDLNKLTKSNKSAFGDLSDLTDPPDDARAARDEMKAAKDELRRMNGKKE